MTAEKRRSSILEILIQAQQPISATVLARAFGVSRQIIVGDVALLRAGGASIAATPRGYVFQEEPEGLRRHIACRHSGPETETELNAIVDNGCTVLDVVVDHPVYGQITGNLHLQSRYDVQQFLDRSAQTQPLSLLTEGIHLHTLVCPDEDAFQRVLLALSAAGFLLEDSGFTINAKPRRRFLFSGGIFAVAA